MNVLAAARAGVQDSRERMFCHVSPAMRAQGRWSAAVRLISVLMEMIARSTSAVRLSDGLTWRLGVVDNAVVTQEAASPDIVCDLEGELRSRRTWLAR